MYYHFLSRVLVLITKLGTLHLQTKCSTLNCISRLSYFCRIYFTVVIIMAATHSQSVFFFLIHICVINYVATCGIMSAHLLKLSLVEIATVYLDTFIYKFCNFESLCCLWIFLCRDRNPLYMMVIWRPHKAPCFSNILSMEISEDQAFQLTNN